MEKKFSRTLGLLCGKLFIYLFNTCVMLMTRDLLTFHFSQDIFTFHGRPCKFMDLFQSNLEFPLHLLTFLLTEATENQPKALRREISFPYQLSKEFHSDILYANSVYEVCRFRLELTDNGHNAFDTLIAMQASSHKRH